MLEKIVKLAFLKKMKFTPFSFDDEFSNGGIYRLYNRSRRVIYVGKSTDLYKRISNHLHKNTHIEYFIDKVKYVDWFIDNDPINQTLLESVFIAYHKPRYNSEVKRKAKN